MLEQLLTRIRTVEEVNRSEEELSAELARQQWVLRAIKDLHPDAAVRTMVDQLIGIVTEPHPRDGQVRLTCRALIEAARRTSEKTSRGRDTLSLATLSGIAAVTSTALAMVIGNRGLIPFFNEFAVVGETPSQTLTQSDVPMVDFVVAILHVAFILVFLVLRATEFGGKATAGQQEDVSIQGTLRQFQRGWTAIWVSWLALYVWMAAVWSAALRGWGLDERILWSGADVFNVVSGVAFFYLFLILDLPSVPLADDTQRDRGFKLALALLIGIAIVLVILSVAGRFDLFGLYPSGPMILSLGVAVAMAYLFGRFDSHFMKVKRWTLAPLYLYVAIQVVWFRFADAEGGQTLRAVFFCLALLLKLYFFVVVTAWLQRGYIRRYLRGIARFAASSPPAH